MTRSERHDRCVQVLLEVLVKPAGFEWTDLKAQTYDAALSDLPIEDLEAAVGVLVQTTRFFPTIAEIREAAAKVSGAPSVETAALVQWTGLERAIEAVGAYSSLWCDDGRTAAAVEQVFGSWLDACRERRDLSPEMWQARAKAFHALFRAGAVGTGALLLGQTDTDNRRNRHAWTWTPPSPWRQSLGCLRTDGRVEFSQMEIDPATALPLPITTPPKAIGATPTTLAIQSAGDVNDAPLTDEARADLARRLKPLIDAEHGDRHGQRPDADLARFSGRRHARKRK